jgi:glucokinase
MPRQPVIGIDLGGTNMQFGVVDETGRITGRARGKTEARRGRDAVVENLAAGSEAACRDAGMGLQDVGAVGIAAAGAIDIPRGVVIEAPNLGWTDLALRDLLEDRLGRPVVLDNDVNGAVWGEHCLGAGRGRQDLAGVWVGTGIGGGFVLRGRLYYGGFFTAGEFGHQVLRPDERPGRRSVEDLCSRTGMVRTLEAMLPDHPGSLVSRLRGQGAGPIGADIIAAAYGAADGLVVQVVNEAADLLGVAIANMVTLLSLRTVIVGGGMTEALGEPYLARIRESFAQTVFPRRLAACELRMTELAADSALLGAALLAREAIESGTPAAGPASR